MIITVDDNVIEATIEKEGEGEEIYKAAVEGG